MQFLCDDLGLSGREMKCSVHLHRSKALGFPLQMPVHRASGIDTGLQRKVPASFLKEQEWTIGPHHIPGPVDTPCPDHLVTCIAVWRELLTTS